MHQCRFIVRMSAFAAMSLCVTRPCFSLENGAARTPPMGWNTFNSYKGGWTDATIRCAADSLVSTGLAQCGYVYVCADGHWNGTTPYWPGKPGFVNWAKPLADYVHAKNLKFGVYMFTSDNPQRTVSDLLQAGVNMIKHDQFLDQCTAPIFKTMSDALVATGEPIVYSIHCANRVMRPEIGNMFRTADDIIARWDVVMRNYDANYVHLSSAGPGIWADPDMLEAGCPYVNPDGTNTGFLLTDAEMRSHFSMWCMMAAPLIMGFDVTRLSSNRPSAADYTKIVALHANTELIAVDQDPLGKPGRRIRGQGAAEVWIKELKDGTKAVAFFNRTASSASMNITQSELGWSGAAQIYVRDLWAHQEVAPFTGTFTRTVATHATEVFRMGTAPIGSQTAVLQKMDRAIAWLASRGHEVFPKRLEPSILAGFNAGVAAFDARGRSIAVDPNLAGAGIILMRAPYSVQPARKMIAELPAKSSR